MAEKKFEIEFRDYNGRIHKHTLQATEQSVALLKLRQEFRHVRFFIKEIISIKEWKK